MKECFKKFKKESGYNPIKNVRNKKGTNIANSRRFKSLKKTIELRLTFPNKIRLQSHKL